jgi:hypothetical protein
MDVSSEIQDLTEAEVNQITGASQPESGSVDLPGFFLAWGPGGIGASIGPFTVIINGNGISAAFG